MRSLTGISAIGISAIGTSAEAGTGLVGFFMISKESTCHGTDPGTIRYLPTLHRGPHECPEFSVHRGHQDRPHPASEGGLADRRSAVPLHADQFRRQGDDWDR